jgi:zinc transporter ZupT
MLSVSLAHILEESVHTSSWAIYAFICGFLCIYLIEELFSGHHHDHGHGDHSHEDPHEHYGHVALISFVAIFLHTIFDGFAIHAGALLSVETGYAVLFGVALHQIPVSLSLAAILE